MQVRHFWAAVLLAAQTSPLWKVKGHEHSVKEGGCPEGACSSSPGSEDAALLQSHPPRELAQAKAALKRKNQAKQRHRHLADTTHYKIEDGTDYRGDAAAFLEKVKDDSVDKRCPEVEVMTLVFMAVIGGCCLLLLILYQCLKAGFFFKTEPPERPDEKDYAELGEAYGTETDDDYLGPSSKGTSRRSSFNTSGSKSDGELALGESASVCGYGRYSDSEYSPGAQRAISAYGEAIDGREDVLSNAGRIQVSASYAPTSEKLTVNIIRAEDVPTKQRGGASTVQVRIVLLPSKKQRFKTKAKPATNPPLLVSKANTDINKDGGSGSFL